MPSIEHQPDCVCFYFSAKMRKSLPRAEKNDLGSVSPVSVAGVCCSWMFAEDWRRPLEVGEVFLPPL